MSRRPPPPAISPPRPRPPPPATSPPRPVAAPLPTAPPSGMPPRKPLTSTSGERLAPRARRNKPARCLPGKIVGCAHSRNGVCTACQAALNMPGQFVTASSQPAEAPGRALASSSSNPAGNVAQAGSASGYGDGMSDPAPVGVVQANFSPAAPMGALGFVRPPGFASPVGPSPNRSPGTILTR